MPFRQIIMTMKMSTVILFFGGGGGDDVFGQKTIIAMVEYDNLAVAHGIYYVV